MAKSKKISTRTKRKKSNQVNGIPAAAALMVAKQKSKSWWQGLTPTTQKVIKWTGVGIGGSLLGYWGFRLWRNMIRESRANSAESKALGEDKHYTWAKDFKLAFDNDGWWGTNVALVRETMREIPTQADYELVEKRYKKLTEGRVLSSDLAGELTSTEFAEIRAIKMQKPLQAGSSNKPIYAPLSWAKRIKAAISYTFLWIPQTDEDAILAVFNEMPSQQAFLDTGLAYQNKYTGRSFVKDLDGDLRFTIDWRAIIALKPKYH